jgi:NAD-dependent SIR2 family protein deacetylase
MYHLEIHIKRAVLSIRNAEALLITSGAGMGIDSGLPDFRGNEGFRKEYPPIAKLGNHSVRWRIRIGFIKTRN